MVRCVGSWTLYTSNRVDALVDALVERMVGEPLPPLQKEIVLVQSRGLSRYLELEVAKKQSIAASLEMPFVGSWLLRLCGHTERDDAWSKAALTLRIFRILGSRQLAKALGAASDYVQDDGNQKKRLALAEALAQRFDDYQLYRPDFLRQFAAGKHPDLEHADWQQKLWRMLLDECDPSAESAHRIDVLQRKLDRSEIDGMRLPTRISVFGVSTMPKAFLEVFARLARFTDVSLYVQRPCAHYFGEVRRARRGEERPEGPVLLANLGNQCRELFDLFVDFEGEGLVEQELESHDPGTGCLLHALQSDVLNMRVRGSHAGADEEPLALRADDDSLRVHSAHGMLREMEILRDQLLARFEKDSTLSPSDVLVLLPDVDAYAPYVHAAFAPVQRILRTVTADRSPGDSMPLAATFLSLFELAGSRYLASDVVQLLEDDALAQKFGIARGQLATLRGLVERARIRWGLDADQRERDLELPPEDANSWAFGLERLLLGVATGPVDGLVLDRAPSADATMSRSELLGSFLALFAAVRHATESLSQPRTMPEWAAAIERTLDALFAPQTKIDKAALQSLRDCCRELRRLAALVADDEDDALVLSPAALREWLANQLDGKREGTGFLSGSLTFASMRPMRSVPMRVIAICGLHDGSFPRSDKRHEFDLMADKRRHGDRSRREDDRQLFLDALLSAKDALVLTYVGRSSKDNAETAPSTVLSELLDHVDEAFTPPKGRARARDAVVVDHPLQSFSERYGDGEDPRLFTYAAAAPTARKAGDADAADRAANAAAASKPVVALDDLVSFWKEPQRQYCERVLQARFPESVDDEQETEPFTLASLDRYAIAQEAVADALATGSSAALPAAAAKTGVLPPGPLGELARRDTERDIALFADRIRPLHGTQRSRVELELDSCVLTGELEDLSAQRQLLWRPSSVKDKDLMRGYVLHCVRTVARDDGAQLPAETMVAGTNGKHTFAALPDARSCLQALLDGYLASKAAPPPVPPCAGFAYARKWVVTSRNKNPDLETALAAASDRYHESDEQYGKDSDLPDPCMTACYGDEDPTERPEFAATADLVHRRVVDVARELEPWA